MKRSVDGYLFKTLLVVVSTLFVSLLIEAILGMAPMKPVRGACGELTSDRCQYSQYHALLGYSGIPNLRPRQGSPDAAAHNSRGHRSPEIPYEKPAGLQRVLLLGDSNTWGVGLRDEQTLRAAIERRLLEQPGDATPIEVLNHGVMGYGTDQTFLQYLIEGQKYAPDVVIYILFENDDEESSATRYWGANKPRFSLKEQQICLHNVPPRRQAGWLNNHILQLGPTSPLRKSATLSYFADREWPPALLAVFDRPDLSDLRPWVDCVGVGRGEAADGVQMVIALLTRLEKRVTAIGGRFLVLLSPDPDAIKARQAARSTVTKQFTGPLQQAGIQLVDLTPAFIDADSREAGPHLDHVGHFTSKGVAVATETLMPALREALRAR